ncbi:hypothetical protein PIB30_037847 [Stylosanthes scabra]|uniref:Uncharacterized protein n=1 Tax=Stylosanthes scabra TaxID=79078 RepID=A0ABU6UCI0_9FABA|nr:hypothetical protein [Stylosanthes scabra]
MAARSSSGVASLVAAAAHGSCFDRDDYHEQEIKQLKNVIRVLQEQERTLELQLHEYCGIQEQETTVMELQNKLKISNMETQMFNLKLEMAAAVTARDGNCRSGGCCHYSLEAAAIINCNYRSVKFFAHVLYATSNFSSLRNVPLSFDAY